jgi:hypothetical protein
VSNALGAYKFNTLQYVETKIYWILLKAIHIADFWTVGKQLDSRNVIPSIVAIYRGTDHISDTVKISSSMPIKKSELY